MAISRSTRAIPTSFMPGGYFGGITRLDRRTNQAQDIMQWPDDPDGHNAGEQKYRYTWTMPIVLSPHDPNVLYNAAQYVFRTNDGGHSWRLSARI